jgi:cytidine deaminase
MVPDLLNTAGQIRRRAYAPYSKYTVGAALLTRDGNVYVGCNVESADYDGTHAEEAALASMVAGGCRSPVMLAVLGKLEDGPERAVLPCGKCRQKLVEFSSLSGYDLDVVVWDGKDGVVPQLTKLSELLPASFGPADIGVDLERYRR